MADEKISAMTSAGALTGAEEVPVVRVGDTVNYATTTQAIANLAAGGAGVTSVAAGALLAGGTITSAGTISVAAIATDTILANATGSSAIPTAVPLGAGLAFSAGALTATGGAGTVTSVAVGAGLAGGTIETDGTISLAAAAAYTILGNATTAEAVPTAVTLGAGLEFVDGALAATGSGSSITNAPAASGALPDGTIFGTSNGTSDQSATKAQVLALLGAAPTAAGSVPSLDAMHILLADGTYITGTQLNALLTPAITATAATLSGVGSTGTSGTALAGITCSLTPSGATAYAVLYTSGADEGARHAFSGTFPALTPGSTGSYTVRVYDAATGGTKLAESSAITVAAPVVTATGCTLANMPTTGTSGSPLTMGSASATITPSGATGYAVLRVSGADEGSRVAFTTTLPALTPATAASYTYAVYAAATGGSPLATSGAITVSAPAGVVDNAYQFSLNSALPAQPWNLTESLNGQAYGDPIDPPYFTLTPTAGGSAIPNTTAVIGGWGTSPTVPPAAAYIPATFTDAYPSNGYVTLVPAPDAPYFRTGVYLVIPTGGGISSPTTFYLWVSVDNGAHWSVYRDGSNAPIGFAVYSA